MMKRMISLPPGMVAEFALHEKRDADSWFVDADPEGLRVGSGGGTAHILANAWKASGDRDFGAWLNKEKRLIIHSGGESRRLPAYASFGKSLIPMPVFRWSKGQSLDQKLLDLQLGFYEDILSHAPPNYRTLVGSGDVMFLYGDRFNALPEADVLVFGLWVPDEVASRHGVFFSRRTSPEELAFVKQKPGLNELQSSAEDYLYLMDSGIVLMNEKATRLLMERCGWNADRGRFKNGSPAYYDLYSDMLTAFGEEASGRDEELSSLKVRMHPMSDGSFYHFGSNRDLIDACLRLQNRVRDQRLTLSREDAHHPSVFLQNARVETVFGDENVDIWIENAHLPATWTLHERHILTGIPDNTWHVHVPPGICINVLPVGSDRYGLHVYGFEDSWKGAWDDEARWMGQDLKQWLEARKLNAADLKLMPGQELFDVALFPLCQYEEIPALLQAMIDPKADPGPWLNSLRISGRDIPGHIQMGRVYALRKERRARSMEKLAANHNRSIFYYLDLDKTASDYQEAGLSLPPELAEGEGMIKQISDSMFRARYYRSGDRAEYWEKRAFGLLREEMISTLVSEPLEPQRNVLDDQILWGRSPVRLDLAGGWTDTPPYCIMEGGRVLNVSIELNGQLPIQVYARPLKTPHIVLRSIDQGQMLEINDYDSLHRYNQLGGSFSIPMAALVLAGFSPIFSKQSFPDLRQQLQSFGCGIEMSLLAAIPKGSGLGTSSNLAASVLGTLSEFCGLNWDRHQLAYRSLILEQMLTSGGGWQDQYGGIFEGIKLLETTPGIRQEPVIHWLPEQLFTDRATRTCMLLYYTGVTRVARDILGEIVKTMFLNKGSHLSIFTEMKAHAQETFEVMLKNDYEGLASKIANTWILNQRLDEGTNTDEIRAILRSIDDLCLGYKLLGAGGGGYLLIMAKSPDAAHRIEQILEKHPPNARARFVDFSVSRDGIQLSRS